MSIETLAEDIKNWNREDIKVLKEKIEELEEEIKIFNNEKNPLDPSDPIGLDDYVDLSSLPSEPFNGLAGHEDAPIWAIDKNRMCLAGEFKIESEAELLEYLK